MHVVVCARARVCVRQVRALVTGEHNLPSEPLFAARDVKQDQEAVQLKHRFKHAQPVPTASAGSILIFLPGLLLLLLTSSLRCAHHVTIFRKALCRLSPRSEVDVTRCFR